MDRRDIFYFNEETTCYNRKSWQDHPASSLQGLHPYAGSWTVNEVSHLLKRTMFGAKKADIDHFLALSPDAAVDELLNTVTIPTRRSEIMDCWKMMRERCMMTWA